MKKTDFKWYKQERAERIQMITYAIVALLAFLWSASGDALLDKWFLQ